MSVHFVTSDTIDACVQFWKSNPLIKRLMSSDECTAMGQSLWLLNAVSLGAQDKENSPSDYFGVIAAYKWKPRPEQTAVLFKSTQYFLNQCAKGNVPKARSYRDLFILCDYFKEQGMENTQAYKLAPLFLGYPNKPCIRNQSNRS